MSFAVAPVATPQRARAFTAVVIAAAVAAAAAGTVALAHGAARDQTTTLAALTLLAALSFVGSGLVAWRRRPQVWTGALMVVAGFCLFAGSLANFDSAVPFTIGLVVSPVAAAVIAHLVLSFPEGRLHSTLERLVVAGAYVVTIPLQVLMLMFMGFEHVTGCPCPSNLLFVRDDMALHSAIMTTQRLLGIALAVAAAGIVVRRWQHASGRSWCPGARRSSSCWGRCWRRRPRRARGRPYRPPSAWLRPWCRWRTYWGCSAQGSAGSR